ncbi:Putative transport protein YhhT [Neomoorella glycerini]|uniref:Transport protein YhhT n=1 Tax=Neomoorella glycerini TaxID=55779 RepID=A0A6I5ZLR1_9FIRM|nr:AI-2E family transporter [Moorella glycerini]QGP90746.1 Putative transport protein YhhT [Moorella glycerini]
MTTKRVFKIWRLAGAGLFLAAALFFLYRVREILTPFLLAAFLAYLLKPAMVKLEKKGLRRPLAILLLYLLILALSLPLFFFILPQLIRELNEFLTQLPAFTAEVEGLLQGFYRRYHQVAIPAGLRRLLDESITNISATFQQGTRQALQALLDLLAGAASFLLAPILAYYLLRDSEQIGRAASHLLPIQVKEDVLGLWLEIDRVLTSFIRGHLLVSLIVGILTGLGLALVGSRYAVILGVVVGLADLIPYFGPVIGAVPVLALTLLEAKKTALYALAVMVIVQQVESSLLAPRILSESVGLHPLVIIFALLAGGELWGVTGLLLAVPLTAIGRILVKFIWARLVSS